MSRTILVVWGECKISPISYNTLTIGPFSETVEVPEGEDVEEVRRRTYEALERFARESYAKKLSSFRAMLAESQQR